MVRDNIQAVDLVFIKIQSGFICVKISLHKTDLEIVEVGKVTFRLFRMHFLKAVQGTVKT